MVEQKMPTVCHGRRQLQNHVCVTAEDAYYNMCVMAQHAYYTMTTHVDITTHIHARKTYTHILRTTSLVSVPVLPPPISSHI